MSLSPLYGLMCKSSLHHVNKKTQQIDDYKFIETRCKWIQFIACGCNARKLEHGHPF